MNRVTLRFWIGVCLAWLGVAGADAAEKDVQFARDIQPLLAKHCLLCHGPDDSEGGLQLHTREGALAELDSGARAIVPGKTDHSELLSRVVSDDPFVRMPPEGEPLSSKEVAVLRAWIENGAAWQVHWAYRPLEKVAPPQVANSQAVRSEIDNFVVAKLEQENIAPSPEADRATLIKRLYYDLIGLPPEPEVVDVFVGDPSEEAYEKLVDRLLASPHFGERWGRHWLDKARYADSDGYEKDNHRPDAWRYRDWVINAINSDLPYDQFTMEQLAGDMLPEATPEQRLATAFHRQTLTNTEGGTDQEQWRVAAVMDRTETVGTVWLGLSVGCARCHTHKYDEISHREYYQLYAYFNNGDEVNTTVPQSSRLDPATVERIAEVRSALDARREELATTINDWLPQLQKQAKAASDAEAAYHPLAVGNIHGPEGVTFTPQEDGSYLVGGANPANAKYTIEATASVEPITGIRVDVLPDDALPAGGPGRAKNGNFVLNEIRLFAAARPKWNAADMRPLVAATADFSQASWPVAGAIDGVEGAGSQGTGWAISPEFGKPHHATFGLDRPLENGETHLQIVLSQTYGGEHTIGRFRVSAVTGKVPGGGLPDDVQQLVLAETRDAAATLRLVRWYQSRDTKSQELENELQSLQPTPSGKSMSVRVIAQRSSKPRSTHILQRGEFTQPLEEVTTGTLATLPPIMARAGKTATDRLDLARWLVDGNNPLVPRVTANHVWKHLFGEGIVPTMNDFGVRGDPPSHPRLLDHLAARLIDDGWSRKALIKYIVMSATYRQSSRHRPELLDVDPTNRLLHRQNRFRVEAEIIRDLSLAAGGLLSPNIGGPSVFPPIPPGVTDLTYNSSFKWNPSQGEDRYRRGMYTYFKRTAPHPNLITFDCPDSNVTNVERDRSNTPIGALVTLNNQSFVEAAQGMAQHVLMQSALTTDDAKLRYALRRCIARVPSDQELADFSKLLNQSRAWYENEPDAASQLIGYRPAKGIAPVENAAWIATLRIMLNLDEFITRE